MELRKILGLSAVAGLLCLTGCTDKTVSGEHEAVTVLATFLDCDRLAELVHEKYPEVNLEILCYSGANTTQYLQNMLAADDLPDICTQTVYDPNINDMSDKMIDLSSYDFTDNYVESRLQDITEVDICSILPTGWYGTIQTVELTEKDIRKLCEEGYDAAGTVQYRGSCRYPDRG